MIILTDQKGINGIMSLVGMNYVRDSHTPRTRPGRPQKGKNMTGYPPFGQDLVLTVDLLLILIVSIYCLYMYSADLQFGPPDTDATTETDVARDADDHNVEGSD